MENRLGGKGRTKPFAFSAIAIACALSFQAQAAEDCSNVEEWNAQKIYNKGDQAQQSDVLFEARWWTQGNSPAENSGGWKVWDIIGDCDTDGSENQVPTVSISSPVSGATFKTGDNVSIVAMAEDVDGNVANVEFYIDGQSVSVDSDANDGFSADWIAVEGSHVIKVVATDDEGATSEASVSVSVEGDVVIPNDPPAVSLSLSATSVNQGDVVTLTAEATDSDGTVDKVDFFVAGRLVGTSATAPYSLDWTSVGSGQVSVYAKATDNDGDTTDSTTVSLEVIGTPTTSSCRPEGLYKTEGVDVPYCTIYDEDGREKMGADHPRRIIGYFTSWRAGDDDQAAYLVKDIPWEQLTHINYAFVSIGIDGKVNIGDVNDPDNAAVGKTWPGVDIDPALGFKGHLGALATYKKRHDVKTLISIGGWAETGGHFGADGKRINDGGFYTMTTNSDGSINHAGIEKFATSAVEFIRQYQFDGVDIDYEYPTSMAGAGNPMDKEFAESRRPYLMRSYNELMRVLREKLDAASAADGTHYMLTIAAPSSGYLLRGMETMDVNKYLDYVNIMSYDLHGAWNDHVGHNAALFDTGKDSELAAWNVYDTAAYGGLGYLNTDWAYHYFRGSMPAGRINIGVPYYTRGWQSVSGGENGLWGSAALPDQSSCPDGTGEGEKNNCGYGAIGIDNMWHDDDEQGNEMGAGSNPMWHAKNLENGIYGTYASAYDLDPVNNPDHKLVGKYERHYDSVAVAPWLWNAEKSVFISTEDKASINLKSDYVVDQGIGGIMFWELAGDYNCYLFDSNGVRTNQVDETEAACKSGNGEYHMGNTMTKAMYDKFASAAPYGSTLADIPMPSSAVDISVSISGFKVGDQNYPINPTLTFTNNTGVDIPGGTEFQFDIPTSSPDNAKDQSGGGLKVIASAHSKKNNVGGLDGSLHRVSFSLPGWKSLPAGESYELDMVYYLPISGPANYTVTVNGTDYAFASEYPELPLGDLSGGNDDDDNDDKCDTTGINVYPNWPQTDWQGNPTHAGAGDKMVHEGMIFQANWWTSSVPGSDASWSKVCG
ncbi:chitinase C-terminal domain-containing protein [Veronia pacifica]|uniref:Chitinase n=1 Tax=Veronia pacifica TaxID=1080227 RepID=A0A1C3EC26_9GAMM|nr:glycosyl hydrolase family 18 protein [Veronia pacifica]ODA30806.1 chitinase [Veronia pacifica]